MISESSSEKEGVFIPLSKLRALYEGCSTAIAIKGTDLMLTEGWTLAAVKKHPDVLRLHRLCLWLVETMCEPRDGKAPNDLKLSDRPGLACPVPAGGKAVAE